MTTTHGAAVKSAHPTDDGEKLATISRGPDRELQGKGITVKARELAAVIDALDAARRFA
jgi:hypothetical protein